LLVAASGVAASALAAAAGCSLVVSTDGLAGAVATDGGGSDADASSSIRDAEAGPVQGLVGRWDFEETTGSVASDSSGRGNAGILNGTATTPGRIGAAARSFDGVNDYVAIGKAPALKPSAAFTLAAWVKPDKFTDSWGGAGFILTDGHDCCTGNGAGMGLHLASGQAPRGFAWTGVADQRTVDGTSMTVGEWHHVALTFDGTSLTVYQEGVKTGAKSFPASVVVPSTSESTVIGRHLLNATSYPFHGAIDDVRIYDRALDSAEVRDLSGGL
jgi:hypothetical protein